MTPHTDIDARIDRHLTKVKQLLALRRSKSQEYRDHRHGVDGMIKDHVAMLRWLCRRKGISFVRFMGRNDLEVLL